MRVYYPSISRFGFLVAFAAMLGLAAPLFGQQKAKYVDNEVLIKFKSEVSASSVQSVLSDANLQSVETLQPFGVYRCQIRGSESVEEAVEMCRKDERVAYAEPNYLYTIPSVTREPVRQTPNDSRWDQLYGMRKIDAPEAWDKNTGSNTIIVGIIDTGVDDRHPDLKDNMWRNPGESGDGKESNGIDDDGNGFVDDVFGWDFVGNDKSPRDANGHGTHVAGTVGAVGNNNRGVAGVVWNVRLMALRFLDSNGSGSTTDAVKCIRYAADNGAHITSNSWGGGGFSSALKEAIEYARDKGSLFVAAAGNDGQNTDTFDNYPSNYNVENVVSVAASDRDDRLASFSNFGQKTVDLAAPGVDIVSAQPGNNYQFLSGTSMATPHVSGAAALVMSEFTGLTYRQVMIRLMGTVDRKSEFGSRTGSGGRLNVNKALGTNPVIALVTRLQNTLDEEGPYLVFAEALDDGSIASMQFTYTVDTGEPVVMVMPTIGVNKYRAEIPGQPKDANIAYFVEATDDAGNMTTSRTFRFSIAEPPDGGCGCGDNPPIEFGEATTVKAQAFHIVLNMGLFILLVNLFRNRPWFRRRKK
jgi:subtilisin family serine protease